MNQVWTSKERTRASLGSLNARVEACTKDDQLFDIGERASGNGIDNICRAETSYWMEMSPSKGYLNAFDT
jgi:hypothetical protein